MTTNAVSRPDPRNTSESCCVCGYKADPGMYVLLRKESAVRKGMLCEDCYEDLLEQCKRIKLLIDEKV